MYHQHRNSIVVSVPGGAKALPGYRSKIRRNSRTVASNPSIDDSACRKGVESVCSAVAEESAN
jgi:hypothetical protein